MNKECEYYLVLKAENERCFQTATFTGKVPYIDLYTLEDIANEHIKMSDCMLVEVMTIFIDKDWLNHGVRCCPWWSAVSVSSSNLDRD